MEVAGLGDDGFGDARQVGDLRSMYMYTNK